MATNGAPNGAANGAVNGTSNGVRKGTYKRLNVAIVGGSLGGLAVGVALKQAGHKTTIFERNPTPLLHNQGAGIVAGGDTLAYFNTYDRCQHAFQCPSHKRLYLDKAGKVIREVEMRQDMTSWDLAYFVLRANYDGLKSDYCELPNPIPTDGETSYRYGCTVHSLSDEGEKGVRIGFKCQPEGAQVATEESFLADLVIGADGPTSKVRSFFRPEVKRTLAGYCALRGTVPEGLVSAEAREAFVERFTFFHGPGTYGGGTQILAYTIPGPNGAIEPGKRLVNFVWYKNFPADSEEFSELMTDRDGAKHRLTLPPGMMDPKIWKKQVAWAKDNMSPQFYELISKTKTPFAQAITDVICPANEFMGGKVLLIGDALAGFRPHPAASTSQAALDAMLLDQYLKGEINARDFKIQTMQVARYIQHRGVQMGNRSQFGENGKLIPVERLIQDREDASMPREEEVFPEWTREGVV